MPRQDKNILNAIYKLFIFVTTTKNLYKYKINVKSRCKCLSSLIILINLKFVPEICISYTVYFHPTQVFYEIAVLKSKLIQNLI